MKKLSILIVISSLVFLMPLLGEEEQEANNVDVKLKVGAKAVGKGDFQGKVNEYQKVDKGVRPVLKARIGGNSGKTFFNLFSDFRGDAKDMFHQFTVDFNRVFKQTFSYDSLYHRLDHDPLTNIDVVSHARSAAYAEDVNPFDDYHITRSEFVSNSVLSIPQLPFLKVSVNFRNETRKGQYQARTLSKCSACHVVAKTRAIDNFNRDISINGALRFGKANANYTFTHNQFKENEMAPTNDYLKVQHPENMKPVFSSRIAYGTHTGTTTMPFDSSAESKKDTHLFQAAVPFSGTSTLTAHYVSSTVKNVTSDLQWKTNSFAGGFSTRLGKKGFFNVRLQQIKIENDSIYIDIPEPVDVAGLNVGLTYADAYGGVFDFTRYSTLNRTVWDIDANFRYRFNKQFRLKLGYEYKQIERDYQDVGSTKSSTFKANLKFRPSRQFTVTLDGKFKSITDPFANYWAGVAPLQQDVGYTNPFVGVQFFQWHAERAAALTNFPESVTNIKARVNWSPSGKFSLNGNYIIRTEKNDLNMSTWERKLNQFGVDMWAAASEKFYVTASYYSYKNNYESLFALPVIEGCGAGIIGPMPGTIVDMMGYDLSNDAIMVNLHLMASKKLSFFGGLSYTNSLAEIVDLALDEGTMPFIPGTVGVTDLSFEDMGGISEYSRLEMKQMIAEFGFKAALTKKWSLNGAFYYYFYDDMTQYLFTDTTGKSYSFFAGFTYSN